MYIACTVIVFIRILGEHGATYPDHLEDNFINPGKISTGLAMHFRCNISFLALCPVLILAASRRNAEDQSCYTEVKNASSGTLEVKPESLTQNTCTWLIVSSVRALVLTVESVNLSNDAFLEVVVNGNPTLLPRQCNGCNVTFSGNIIKITYSELSNKGNSNGFVKPKKYLRVSTSNSSMSPTPELKKTYLKSNLTSLPHVPQSSLFVIRYRSLSNLECDPPSFPINYASFPFVEGSGLKLGSQIRYGCSRPYTPAQGSLLTATCVLNSTTSLPIWNNPSPLCMLPECDSSPIRFSLDDNQSSIILQQENLIVGTQKRCVWEIVTIPKKHIVAQIDLINFPTYLDFEKQSGGVLELYDGKMSDSRLLARLTGNVSAHPQIYFTLFDTLIISLHSEAPAHIVDHNGTTELDDNDYNFDISITLTAEVSLCKTPSLPANGNVKRQQLLDAPLDKRTAKNVVIAYSCNPGYKMYGSNRSSCLGNGKWSDHPPSCFPLRSFDDNVESDNATLTHNWKDLSSEDAISSEKFPQSRMPKVCVTVMDKFYFFIFFFAYDLKIIHICRIKGHTCKALKRRRN